MAVEHLRKYDLAQLERLVITRARRLGDLTELRAPPFIVANEWLILGEAYEAWREKMLADGRDVTPTFERPMPESRTLRAALDAYVAATDQAVLAEDDHPQAAFHDAYLMALAAIKEDDGKGADDGQ